MAKFVGRLAEELGERILTGAEAFRFGNNRRLVSTDPNNDFAYGNEGRVYAKKKIASTERHWIMTGIDNDEKKRVLTLPVNHLGLPSGMCVIEVIKRENILDEFIV
jgi:hypothetical protein